MSCLGSCPVRSTSSSLFRTVVHKRSSRPALVWYHVAAALQITPYVLDRWRIWRCESYRYWGFKGLGVRHRQSVGGAQSHCDEEHDSHGVDSLIGGADT